MKNEIKSSGYSLILELIGLPKTINQTSGAHWSVRAQQAKKWHTMVYSKLITTRQSPPPKPLDRARIVFTRYSSRSMDGDNLAHSFKHVLDALKKTLIIKDDDWKTIGMPEYRWEKVSQKEGRIKIEVYEVNDLPIGHIKEISNDMKAGA